MLAVEPLRGSNGDEREGARGGFAIGDGFGGDEAALLEDISFSDLFMGIDVTVEDDDGDLLPDLELDPAEIFAEFSVGTTEDSGATTAATGGVAGGVLNQDLAGQGEEEASAMSNLKEDSSSNDVPSQGGGGDKAGRKPSPPPAKGSQGKRKAKVDWTPELHRRFVQAVEQLGIDKAVPSRILELMGIDCLTRHNIASHLQKYRSHRKHLLAREAEAASWSQRRQMYGAPAKKDVNPWLAPTIGFPPPPPAPPQVQQFRPLHVWGHPPGEAPPMAHPWLRPLAPRSVPPPSWVVQPPDPASYWHHPYPRLPHTFVGREGWIPQAMTQGTPCFPQPLPAATRFAAPAVPGIVPHHAMYRAVHAAAAAAPPPPAPINNHSSSQLQLDAHPSIESIDAAIGDVLAKPWLPLPLGLKPPAVDSVLVELQKQGVPKVPPAACG